jgi:hypothetical protein
MRRSDKNAPMRSRNSRRTGEILKEKPWREYSPEMTDIDGFDGSLRSIWTNCGPSERSRELPAGCGWMSVLAKRCSIAQMIFSGEVCERDVVYECFCRQESLAFNDTGGGDCGAICAVFLLGEP